MSSLPSTDGPSTTVVIAATALATIALTSLVRLTLYPRHPQIFKSPLKTVLPTLSPNELDELDYKPDAFPGARDVDTPYGSMRVYEWGPEAGPKVLLIHGITTTCQTLGPIAHDLASKGRRVLLFDLFGRGFSDAPSDLPHDARLYVAQALLALASSPLAGWTGAGARLRVVGYSMGGGVAVHLVAALPAMVESLTLLAPAGLIRPAKFGALPNLVFRSGLVPENLLAALTRRRLQRPIASSVRQAPADARDGVDDGETEALLGGSGPHLEHRDPLDAALSEAADDGTGKLRPTTRLEVKVLRYVQWMVKHHPGFVPSFMSSLRHAPLMGQHEAYRRLGETGVPVACVFGRADEIVDEATYREDGLGLLGGEDRVVWRLVPGGHDFPMTHTARTLQALEEFWERVPRSQPDA